MKEVIGNIWSKDYDGYIRCITTNGNVKSNKKLAVMGKGIAAQATKVYPELQRLLGELLVAKGNHTYYFSHLNLITFPTKENWFEKSTIARIKQSANELMEIAYRNNLENILLPRPGCENGGLTWAYVRPHLIEILDDRVTVITRESPFNATS